MDRDRLPAKADRGGLPDHPDLARFVATLFERLGGRLEIDAQGQRHLRRPGPFRFDGADVPQLPDARPGERFRSREEWQGAMKLAEYWIARLSAADRDYVFTLLAQPELDPQDGFDFRARL